MNTTQRLQLALHGTIVILLGLLAGFPYAFVATGMMAGEERAWRMAHAEGIQNGMLMLAVSGAAGHLVLGERRSRLCVLGLVVAGYGNVAASVIGAASGNRGLEFAPPVANVVVYLLFVVAVVGVVSSLVLVALGARDALRARA